MILAGSSKVIDVEEVLPGKHLLNVNGEYYSVLTRTLPGEGSSSIDIRIHTGDKLSHPKGSKVEVLEVLDDRPISPFFYEVARSGS